MLQLLKWLVFAPLFWVLTMTASFAGEQIVVSSSPAVTAVPGTAFVFQCDYQTANPQNSFLPGLGLRIHWDSRQLNFEALVDPLSANLIGQGGPEPDSSDFDGDPNTDMFINMAWFDFSSMWPGLAETRLFEVRFNPLAGFVSPTHIRFSASATAPGYVLQALPVTISPMMALNPPTLQQPGNLVTQVDISQLFSWIDTNTAPQQEQGYEIRWKPMGSSYTMAVSAADTTAFNPGPLLEETTYTWNVRAKGDGIQIIDSPWANGGNDWVFTTKPPAVAQPDLAASPQGYRFDDVALDTPSAPKIFRLINQGDGPLDLGQLSLTGPDAAAFSFENDACSQRVLAAGGQCTVSVRFLPVEEAEKTANLQIPSSDPHHPDLALPLFGTGRLATLKMSAYRQKLMENGTSEITVWFDQITGHNRTINFTSTVAPLGQPGLSHPGQVTIAAGSQLARLTIRATHNQLVNQDRTVSLTAQTAEGQTASVALEILDDDRRENNQGRLRMIANGVVPGSDDDGDGIFEAGEDIDYQVSLQNTGGTGLPQTTVNFSVLDTFDLRFPGDAACMVGFLNPNQVRECDNGLRAHNDVPPGRYRVQMMWQDGSTQHSTLRSVDVVNPALPDYYIYSGARSRIMLPGERYAGWSVFARRGGDGYHEALPQMAIYRQDSTGRVEILRQSYSDVRYLASKEDLELVITAPYEPGTYLIWVEIDPDNLIGETNESNNRSANFTLTVPAPAMPNLALTPQAHQFGTINTGTISAPQVFTITNDGNADLVLGAVSLSGASPSQFAVQNNGCGLQTLNAGQSCTVTLAFNPSVPGVHSASLNVVSNDPEAPLFAVPLAGTATMPNVPPSITITQPGSGSNPADAGFWIVWEDTDPDDNAQIDLFYDLDDQPGGGTRINPAPISENNADDRLWWDTSAIAAGNYYIYAVISDGSNPPVTRYSNGFISVSHAPPPADLSVVLTVNSVPLIAGGQVELTATVNNLGPGSAPGGLVETMLPPEIVAVSWTCEARDGAVCSGAGQGNITASVDLPAGGSLVYLISGTIDAAATGELVSRASVTPPANVNDPQLGNNNAVDSSALVAQADLSLALRDSVDPVETSSQFTYTLTPRNDGPSHAQNPVVTLNLPSGLTVETVIGEGWHLSQTGSGIRAMRTSLSLGTAPIVVTVTAPASAGPLNASAAIDAASADLNPANNAVTETTVVEDPPPCVVVAIDQATTGAPGGEAVVPVSIGTLNGAIIESFNLELRFDPQYLSFIASHSSGTLTDGWGLATNNDTPGTVIVSGAHTQPLAAMGRLLNLGFQLADNVPQDWCGDIRVHAVQFNEGTPSACTQDGGICACLLGDVTHNGEVSAFDAAQILKHSAQIGTPFDPLAPCAADVSCNGTISAFDAAQILKFSAQIIDTFPCQQPRGSGEIPAHQAVAAFPDNRIFLNEPGFLFPVVLQNPAPGTTAFNLHLRYDPEFWQFSGVQTQNAATHGWLLGVNTSLPGELRISAAGLTPLHGSNLLLFLEGTAQRAGVTPLEVVAFELNEGQFPQIPEMVPVEIRACRFPGDFLSVLPSWPHQRKITEIINLLKCSP